MTQWKNAFFHCLTCYVFPSICGSGKGKMPHYGTVADDVWQEDTSRPQEVPVPVWMMWENTRNCASSQSGRFCNANFKLCAMARCCLCWKKHGVDTNLNESLKKRNMGQKRYSSNLSIPIIFCRMLWRCPLADNRVNIIRVGRCRCVQENRRLCTQCETGIKRVGAIHAARFFLPWRDLTVRCAHFPAVMHIQKVTRKPSAGKRDSCNVQR